MSDAGKAAAASPPPSPGSGGGNGADWTSSLPEGLRGNAAFKDVKDVGALAQRYADTQRPFAERLPEKYKNDPLFRDIKDDSGLYDSFANAQRLVGADKNRVALLPKDDKDVEGWNNFYKAQGRPDTADKYTFGKRADGSDYGESDVNFQKQMAPILHKMGVTQRQLDLGRGDWDKLQADITAAAEGTRKADMEKATAALRSKWGGDYDGHIKDADAAIKHYGKQLGVGDQLTKELTASELGNSPALAMIFAHMGAQLREDGLLGKGEGGFGDKPSMERAKQMIAEKEAAFRANKDFKDKSAPGRQEALEEIAALYEVAYPAESAEAT
jgi:hypothetical protein